MKLIRAISSLLLLIVVAVQVAFAATLADYRERLEKARSYAFELADIVGEADEEFENEIVAEIKAAVPASERVDLPGGSLETDNQWLRERLDDLERERDEAKRRFVINEIGARLSALAGSVRELEAAAAAARSKDEDKQKLAEILRRAEYQKPEPKEESVFQKWWREFVEWLRSIWPQPNLTPGTSWNLSSIGPILQIVIFALVIALIGFVVWRLAPFLSNRFSERAKRKRGDRIILGERVGADESAADLFSEAEALAREGNLRGAIRKGYIAVLCELGDRKLVRLARHKTNRDYLRDVRKIETVFTGMTGLTHNFERTWYGLRSPEQADWDEFRALYTRTVSK